MLTPVADQASTARSGLGQDLSMKLHQPVWDEVFQYFVPSPIIQFRRIQISAMVS